MSIIAPGTPSPAFRLAREDGSAFTEQDLRGKRSMLVFYPFAFSPVCTDQLQLYEGALAELSERGVELYGVSCDSTWAQTAFREKLGVSSRQLSDFEPKGAACAAFGVLHQGGFPQRALVAIGPDAVVRWSYEASSPAELPGVEVLREGMSAAFEGAAASACALLAGGKGPRDGLGARSGNLRRSHAARAVGSAKLVPFGREK
jgi:peroxiredoxin